MRVIRVIDREINKCYHQCPYFGGDVEVMICDHPDAEDKGYIITYPDCMNGFPAKCPLIEIENMKTKKNAHVRLKFESLWRDHFRHLPPLDSMNILKIEKLKEFTWEIYKQGYNFGLDKDS